MIVISDDENMSCPLKTIEKGMIFCPHCGLEIQKYKALHPYINKKNEDLNIEKNKILQEQEKDELTLEQKQREDYKVIQDFLKLASKDPFQKRFSFIYLFYIIFSIFFLFYFMTVIMTTFK